VIEIEEERKRQAGNFIGSGSNIIRGSTQCIIACDLANFSGRYGMDNIRETQIRLYLPNGRRMNKILTN